MAASQARFLHAFRNLKKQNSLLNKFHVRRNSNISGKVPKDVLSSKAVNYSGESIVILENASVQTILKRMTGMDFDKIFKPRKESLQNPIYKVMDREEFEEVFQKITD